MKIEQCMTRSPQACVTHESLARAAQLMWDGDFGSVPVLDTQGKLVGMITDRDICMAAYTQGRHLSAIGVASAMARKVYSCGPKQTVDAALKIMRAARVRRLPVLDASGKLVGVLSLSDVWRPYQDDGRTPRKLAVPRALPATMAAVCSPWRAEERAGAATSEPQPTARTTRDSVLRPMPRRAAKAKPTSARPLASRARPHA